MTGRTNISPLALCAVTLAILCGPGTAIAKCETAEIVVRGPGIGDSLSVPAAEGAAGFNVWNGPRVRINGKAVHLDPAHARGNFVDWRHGPVAAPPDGNSNFRISFLCRFEAPAGVQEIYAIDYSFLPGIDGGYVYLPGRNDARYASNVATIIHGVEGNWYRSTQDWERIIRPILENAIGN